MSRSANQTKTEPFPASASESETETPAADAPQAPSVEGARALAGSDDTAPGTSEELPVVQGVHTPEVTG